MTMGSPTKPSIAASSQGPAMFHTAMARFKRTMSARGAVAAPKTSFTETADETSSEKSVCEPVVEEIGAATRPQVPKNDIATVERRHDSVFSPTTEQAATSSTIGTLTPRPQRKILRQPPRVPEDPRHRPSELRTKADDIAFEDEGNGESIAAMRKRLYDDLEHLDDKRRQLDQIVADMDAQDAAAAQERAWEVQIRAAREQREAAARRLAQRIVAEVVPMSASGRTYGDVAEIRRCAAPKAEYQMVPDGNYPRFRLS